MITLARLPRNPLDPRQQIPVSATSIHACWCGAMPLGIEYASDLTCLDGSPDISGACVVIECPGHLQVMSETQEGAVGLWSNRLAGWR